MVVYRHTYVNGTTLFAGMCNALGTGTESRCGLKLRQAVADPRDCLRQRANQTILL